VRYCYFFHRQHHAFSRLLNAYHLCRLAQSSLRTAAVLYTLLSLAWRLPVFLNI
jgi:hypothetical protein